MRIAHITSGAAGMYCGSCMNANTIASALIARGHEVALLPTYTPMRIDEAPVARNRIFFGAINVYLQQRWPIFRRTPWLLDKVLDRPALLARLMRWSYEVDNEEIGALTLSMLEGESGHQAKELEKLVAWLRDDFKPDLVHLSFTFFLGFARRLRQELGVPIVCSVQGEEIMLDQLPKAYRESILAEMRSRVRDVDAVISPCHDYAGYMSELLATAPGQMQISELGIAADDYLAMPSRALAAGDDHEAPVIGPTVGYLARICKEKGAHVLLDAFLLLAAQHPTARLRMAGFISDHDKPYVAEMEAKIAASPHGDRIEIIGEVDREAKLAFLRDIDVFSVPTVYREPKGLFLLEAMACGIPVVAPNHGSFPELLAHGGGELVPVGDAPALAEALLRQLEAPAARQTMAAAGRQAVQDHFTADAAARRIESVYRSVAANSATEAAATSVS